MKLSIASPLALPALLLTAAAWAPAALAKKKILIYSYTESFRHDSIPTAVQTIKSLGQNNSPGWDSVHSEDPDDFHRRGYLDQFDALVFVSVSGKALDARGADNMRKYIENGGGYMGIHEACDALNNYSWYGRLVGAYFDYHPEITHAILRVEDKRHPSVAHLGNTWKVYDEMYNYNSNPRAYGKKLVLSADDDSYPDPVTSKADKAAIQGKGHPIAWYKEGGQLDYNPHVKVGGGTDPKRSDRRKGVEGKGGDGRSFYTALGHTNETWHESDFQGHILGALHWVLDSPSLKSSGPDAESWRPGSEYDASEQGWTEVDGNSSGDGGDGSDGSDGGYNISSKNINTGINAHAASIPKGTIDPEVFADKQMPYSSGNLHSMAPMTTSNAAPAILLVSRSVTATAILLGLVAGAAVAL
ncbi:hypothetical protein ACQY0O_006008 [Thecaphora frezii]